MVETFWGAYRGRARFDASRSFGAWIRQIATNVAPLSGTLLLVPERAWILAFHF